MVRDPQGAIFAIVTASHGDPPDSEYVENNMGRLGAIITIGGTIITGRDHQATVLPGRRDTDLRGIVHPDRATGQSGHEDKPMGFVRTHQLNGMA